MSSSQSALNKLFVAIVETIDRRCGGTGSRPRSRWCCSRASATTCAGTTSSTPTTPPRPPRCPPPSAADLVGRTADGADNDLAAPAMGMAGTRFGRNVPLAHAEPETARTAADAQPAPGQHPAARARRRDDPGPVRSTSSPRRGCSSRRATGSATAPTPSARSGCPGPTATTGPTPELVVPRTQRDPHAVGDMPATFVNTETHWWDASQIYGTHQGVPRGRAAPDLGTGKVAHRGRRPDRPRPGAARQLRRPRRLVGRPRAAAHPVHARAQRRLRRAARAPTRRGRTTRCSTAARLIVAALIAKIHTVEWTTAILAHPALRIGMRANWFGLAGERVRNLLGRLVGSEIISGIPGSATDHHAAPVLDHRGVRRGLPDAPADPRRARACARRRRPADRHACRSSTPRGCGSPRPCSRARRRRPALHAWHVATRAR